MKPSLRRQPDALWPPPASPTYVAVEAIVMHALALALLTFALRSIDLPWSQTLPAVATLPLAALVAHRSGYPALVHALYALASFLTVILLYRHLYP